MKPHVSESTWLQELAKLSLHKGEGMTTLEMAKEHRVSVDRMRLLLKEASRLGWLHVDYRHEICYDGKNRRLTVYVVRKPK